MSSAQEQMTDWFRKSAELTEATLKATARVQMESLERWMEMMSGMRPAQNVGEQTESIMSQTVPAAQKTAREYMQGLDRAYRKGLDLMNECFESTTSGSPEGLQDCVQKAWGQAWTALQSSSQAMLQANTRAMNAWADLLGQSSRQISGIEKHE